MILPVIIYLTKMNDEYVKTKYNWSFNGINAALTGIFQNFLAKWDKTDSVPVVRHHLDYQKQKDQPFYLRCHCYHYRQNYWQYVHYRRNYSALLCHIFQMTWWSWKETTSSYVQYLSQRIKNGIGSDIKVRQNKNQTYYQWQQKS